MMGYAGGSWTGGVVEERLVEAFRSLPCHPVFSDHARVRAIRPDADPYAEALSWARFADRRDSLALLTWAQCRASGRSVRERYRDLGWSRTTAERARQRALARIVDGLRAG